MKQIVLHVTTIHCGSCERRIERAVGQLEGVRQVKANQQTGEVRMLLDEIGPAEGTLRTAIERAGFEVQP